MDSQSGAYFEQASFDLRGHFNIAAFAASLDVLVQRHTVLRTNFYSGWKMNRFRSCTGISAANCMLKICGI
ncbi:hypothetical protein [Paenibacillus polymyxa]|uniref:hypothetical protein n=1 Tax=Paenibacillus polymyxa TaxID=1406 RepID=UPI00215C7B9E|nr:hypothetical protein [Paenibacillus polymyxa]